VDPNSRPAYDGESWRLQCISMATAMVEWLDSAALQQHRSIVCGLTGINCRLGRLGLENDESPVIHHPVYENKTGRPRDENIYYFSSEELFGHYRQSV